MAAAAGHAQAPAEKLGVSSAKINPRGTGGMVSFSPYGAATWTATNVTLELLVELAFGVAENQIWGGDRLGNETYNIAVQPESGGKVSYERLKPLLRQLLAERFHLATHEETKEVPGYGLVVAKGGPKLKANQGAQGPGQFTAKGMSASGITMDTLATMLARPVGRPVVNRTGIEGSFDVRLSYADTRVPGSETSELPAVFTAVQEQLGLKLESQKVPLKILAIDRCERVPAEN
jgi:uncharacterized protein (TIGR03435 family)